MIKTSIVPLTDWYLRELDKKRKLYLLLRMSYIKLIGIKEKAKTVLENARTI